MHELYIAECILKAARKALPDDVNRANVSGIHVRVGQLDAVVPESLQFLFDAIKAQHDLPNAQLEIAAEQVQCQCNQCEARFSIAEPVFICPTCESVDVSILAGRGIVLQSITVKEEA